MTTPIDSALVQRLPCFRDLTAEEAVVVARQLERVELPDGTLLFSEGDAPDDGFYFVISGQVEIQRDVPGEAKHILATLGPGTVFGEIGPLLQEPRSASAVARGGTELGRFSAAALENAAHRGETWAGKFLLTIAKVMARRLVGLDREVAALIAGMRKSEGKSAPTRVAELDQLRKRLFTEWSF